MQCIQILNDLIWKYNVVTLDRLILYLVMCKCFQNVTKIYLANIMMLIWLKLQALRSHEGNEAQVCFFIIQLLLLKPAEFRTRVNSFVRDVCMQYCTGVIINLGFKYCIPNSRRFALQNSPCHWKQNDYYEKHMNYHRVCFSVESYNRNMIF